MGLRQEQRRHIDAILQYADDDAGMAAPTEKTTAIIGRSWKRCIQEYGLDPSRPRPARIVTHQTLLEHQDSADEFLNVARAGVEQLYKQIAQLGYVLLLTDERGITVQFLGNKHHNRRLRQAGLYLGADWSERYAGTCAVGTCIQEQQSLTCHRVDHFDATHITLTCTAVPITDPLGNLLAVLDISSLDSARARDSQNFALHLITLYARMIEDAYFLRRYHDWNIFRCDASRELVQMNGQHLFAIDGGGRILAANTAARRLVAQQTQQAEPTSGTGMPLAIHDMFDCELGDIWNIPYGSQDQVRAFRVHGLNEIYFGTLIEPKQTVRQPAADRPAPSSEAVPALDVLAGDDPSMRKTLSLAKRLRNRTVNLLILGETGTGKERLARAIHDASERARLPFVAVNCAAIPESLIESELFGYQGGAFTGARSKGMRGLIQQADGGTLFLDEIGDMPLHLQSRLLRVLSEGEILPLGAVKPIQVDLRVLSATHQDLAQLIAAGAFRADLYYRLTGATLRLPALRERADRQHVIQSVFNQLSAERNAPALRLRADAMSALLGYGWPGNIRQLANTLAFAEATCDGQEITVNNLPEECLVSLHAADAALDVQEHHPAQALPPAAQAEAQTLAQALRRAHWNITLVARQFGVSRPTIYRRMRRFGLIPPNLRLT